MPSRSESLFQEAQTLLPGGVNSPVRAFGAVGGVPPFIERGQGSRIYDADGREYIDYVGSWGPLILGHADPRVITAVQRAAERGTSFGAPTELESRLARLVIDAVASIEMLRFVSSGTEACMSAIRVARAFTSRDKIIKFEGCYHGHADGLLVRAGSGGLTFGVPDSAGVPSGYANLTLVARYNDVESVRALLEANQDEVAAIIVEPVAANMGVVPPTPEFLPALRRMTDAHGALLIFDEVITGFRVAYGGAQELYGVTPDLTCLGKIIGGGLPVAAYGGRRDIMEMVAPLGPAYQAGTLSGNPLAMSAGIATLQALAEPGVYDRLERAAARLEAGLRSAAEDSEQSIYIARLGSVLTVFFTPGPVTDFASAVASDKDRFAAYFHSMLEQGIYLAPSQFEALFVSLAHSSEDIDRTIEAARQALSR
ncbi:MAG: glutamate-1-semialdehyde 2,1-aminomutase [Chloroflexi bacterium]|nr:glutamate-1-semialdehyde 2,1-aminomutase [Chloroflexota bacterium]